MDNVKVTRGERRQDEIRTNQDMKRGEERRCSKGNEKVKTRGDLYGHKEELRGDTWKRDEEEESINNREEDEERSAVPGLVGAANPAAVFGDDEAEVHPQSAVSGTSVRPHMSTRLHD